MRGSGFGQNTIKALTGSGMTVPREAGLAKNWARDTGFMFACLSGMPETVTSHRF